MFFPSAELAFAFSSRNLVSLATFQIIVLHFGGQSTAYRTGLYGSGPFVIGTYKNIPGGLVQVFLRASIAHDQIWTTVVVPPLSIVEWCYTSCTEPCWDLRLTSDRSWQSHVTCCWCYFGSLFDCLAINVQWKFTDVCSGRHQDYP